MKLLKWTFVVLFASAMTIACGKDDDYNEVGTPEIKSEVVQGTGDLENTLAAFRSLIGDSLNKVPGKTSGRREIKWDGVPANAISPLPLDFFNNTEEKGPNGRKQGLVYRNTGVFIVLDTNRFASIDASYLNQFDPFSPPILLTTFDTTVSELAFKIPGSNTDAFIKGFGVIFSDVDDAASTSLEFYNETKSLGIFYAPVRSTGSSFSFLGVYFPDEKVTRVKITSGNGILTPGKKDISDGGKNDLVVMDDFFYNEPASLH